MITKGNGIVIAVCDRELRQQNLTLGEFYVREI